MASPDEAPVSIESSNIGKGESASRSRQASAAAVDEMLSFMQARQPVDGVDLKALINEGRA